MTDPILEKADKAGLVVGLKHLNKIVARQDIDVLLKYEPDTFNLFLLAFKELKEDPDWDTRSMSFWQIAGIHGLPNFQFWNGVRGKQTIGTDQNKSGSGYCEHSSLKFPTWHRPYLALLEQALYRKMLEIANKYTKPQRKSDYLKAVEKFRLPYWDYHRPRNYDANFTGIVNKDRTTSFPYDFSVPQIFTLENIKVRKYPTDELVQMANPLHHFQFHSPKGKVESMTTEDWNVSGIDPTGTVTKATTRWRTDQYKNSLDRLNQAVNEYREDSVRVSLVLVENGVYNPYGAMATSWTTAKDPLDGTDVTGSLENVHNNYHVYIGGDPFVKRRFVAGHMSSVPTAAFDPIFWAHHCQIDRIFAVWQASHEKSWFDEAHKDDAKENLLPFLTAPQIKGKDPVCWTSNQSRYTTDFGYTYPEIEGIEKGHSKDVQDAWKDKYGWARRLKAQKPGDTMLAPPFDFRPLDLSDCPFFKGVPEFVPLRREEAILKLGAPTARLSSLAVAPLEMKAEPAFSSDPSAEIVEKEASREWYVDMVVEKLVLNNSFTVMYFIGPRDPDASSYILDPSFAGLTHIFTAPVETCINCQTQKDDGVKITGTAPITSLLLDYVTTGALPSMKTEDVQPFLVKHLKWLIVEVNGTQHNTREIADRGGFALNVTCKVAPLPGKEGAIVYESYPQIIAEIIANSS